MYICYEVPIVFDMVQEPQQFLKVATRPGWQAAVDMEMQLIHDNHI